MRRSIWWFGFSLLFFGVPLFLSTQFHARSAPSPTPPGLQTAVDLGRLPCYFIENRGQLDPRVMFYQRRAGQTILFTREGMDVHVRRPAARVAAPPGLTGSEKIPPPKRMTPAPDEYAPALIRMTPVGMQPGVEIISDGAQAAKFNFFLGNDPDKWRTDVPSYTAVVYRQAYSGIDLKFYGAGQSLEYDVIVAPGADPSHVAFSYTGIVGLEITPEGDLAIKLPDGGELRQQKPVVYQEIGGLKVAREGKFRLGPNTAGHVFGFEVAAYDLTAPLIIDPKLVYSSYLGGESSDTGWAIAVDKAGCAYIAGSTQSDGLATLGALQPNLNGTASDAFVAKVSATGKELLFFTYFGGTSYDYAYGLALGTDGSVYIAGNTISSDFPLCHNILGMPAGSSMFVTHLTAAGNGLLYSTRLGGSGNSQGANAMAVDGDGNVYLTGSTDSTDFPVTAGAFQATFGGYLDAFVLKLGPDTLHVISINPLVLASYPDILMGTYLGGQGLEWGLGIAVGGSGRIYVAGRTESTDFYTDKAYQTQYHGQGDAFITGFNTDGSVHFSTYLGGYGLDYAQGVAVDQPENIYVTGVTYSPSSFPLSNPVQINFGGGDADAFVTKLHPPLFISFPGGGGYWLSSGLEYSTFLGGHGYEEGNGIAVDAQGCAHVAGVTFSADFPFYKSPFTYKHADLFVTRLTASGSGLSYSICSGSSNGAIGHALALDTAGNAYVTGETYGDFPIKNAFQSSFGSLGTESDAFVLKVGKFPVVPHLLLLGD